MPIYEYECPEHGRFAVMQSMTAEREASCPSCNKPAEFRVSLSNFRIATPFSVVDSDGRVRHHQPDGGRILPSVKDIARDAKKEEDYA